jgi:hypothetical protein
MKQLLLILTVISLVSCNEQRDTYLIQSLHHFKLKTKN